MNSMQLLQLMVMLLSIDIHLNRALYLSNLSVPRIIDAKQKAKLFCSYEIGNRTLNSVKWYKDGQEFFRYSPLTPPTTNWFPVKGVTIADGSSHCNQFICNVELEKLNVHSSGSYRCEVSGDAPEFKLIDKTANMTVGVLPKYDPFISGLQPIYRYGDFIILNCSSEWSNPSVSLTWYINNKTAPLTNMQPQINEITHNTDDFILYASTKQLRMHINEPRYRTTSDTLALKCISDILGISSLQRHTDVTVNILAIQDATTTHRQRLLGSSTTTTGTNISPSISIITYHYTLLVIITTIITTILTTIIRNVKSPIIDITSHCLLSCLINAIVIVIWPIYHDYLWNWS